MVGDSTMCSFNDAYYYPRYGYGTQLGNYLDSRATINNLALSGRSSTSFKSDLEKNNYQQMVDGLSEGDYLIIGFGHNDEKDDDATRYTTPDLDAVDVSGSFQNSLYYNYVKVAIDAGATPILCTPIVRANKNDDYSGTSGHVYSSGDYAACIRDLAEDYDVTCIDLTKLTATLYAEIGYDEAIYYHAWTSDNPVSVDTTHLNIYGAKQVAYMFADALRDTDCKLGDYVLDDIAAPDKSVDLVPNPDYDGSYEVPNLDDSTWQSYKLGTYLNVDWYKSAFGDTSTDNPYGAGFLGELDQTNGKFTVGQSQTQEIKDEDTGETTTSAKNQGKITSTEGNSYVFTRLAGKQNFKIVADVEVISANSSSESGSSAASQSGFGIMLRDDMYTPNKDSGIISNYVASGMYIGSSKSNIIYSRESGELTPTSYYVSGLYEVGDTAKITMERNGGAQNTTCTIEYKNQTYTYSYYDFDYVSVDYEYSYLCFYATRGTVVEFSNVTLELGEIVTEV